MSGGGWRWVPSEGPTRLALRVLSRKATNGKEWQGTCPRCGQVLAGETPAATEWALARHKCRSSR